MKLIAELNGQRHELTLEQDAQEPSRFIAVIDERRYEIATRKIAAGTQLIIHNEQVYQCRVDKTSAHGEAGSAEVYVGNQAYGVSVIDPKRLRSKGRTGVQAVDGAAQIVAQMPGKVVRVLVEQGATVETGDGLIVVEAMKMQNEMKAPRRGVIAAINTEAGATVNAGDVLAVIE